MSVEVDAKFARFGSKSFAINKITSVDVRKRVQPPRQGWILLGGLAAFMLMAWVGSREFVWLLIALVLGGLSYKAWRTSAAVTTYRLYLVTAGSEAQAYETDSLDEITRLRDAIEEAMAAS